MRIWPWGVGYCSCVGAFRGEVKGCPRAPQFSDWRLALVGFVGLARCGSVEGVSLRKCLYPGDLTFGRVLQAVGVALVLLLAATFDTFDVSMRSRGTGIDLSAGVVGMTRLVSTVRSRAGCLFICDGGGMSLDHGMGVGTGGGTMSRVLSRIFSKANVACIVRNGGVILAGRDGVTHRRMGRRGAVAIGNTVASVRNRTVVNTGVVRRNAAGNAVASVSNGFALRIPTSTRLIVSCVNCGGIVVPMGKGAGFAVGVRSSTLGLRAIMMATVNVGGGRTSLACSARRLGNSRLGGMGSTGVVGSLTNGSTNIRVAGDSSNLKNSTGMSVHNTHSTFTDNGGRPLCIVSNIPVLGVAARSATAIVKNRGSKIGRSSNSNISGLGPSSVRDVDVLGNTSTTTLCNSRTTGNIVLVAAGSKGTNVSEIAFSSGLAMSRTIDLPRFRGGCKRATSNADD